MAVKAAVKDLVHVPNEAGYFREHLAAGEAVFDIGYTRWLSMEVFHTGMWKSGSNCDSQWLPLRDLSLTCL